MYVLVKCTDLAQNQNVLSYCEQQGIIANDFKGLADLEDEKNELV